MFRYALLSALVVISVGRPATADVIIDSFDTAYTLAANAGMNSASFGSSAIGGETDVGLMAMNGQVSVESDFDGQGLLRYQQGLLVSSITEIVWDGTDSDPGNLASNGLGGVDLTSGGTDTGIQYTIRSLDTFVNLLFIAYSPSGDSSILTALAGPISTASSNAPSSVFVPFGDFTPSSGSGADFQNIGALELNITSPFATVLDIAEIRSTAKPIPAPAAAPLLAIGLTLLLARWFAARPRQRSTRRVT